MTSYITIFTLSNGMIGSAPIVLPVLYKNFGFINGLIYSTIIAIATCFTCLIIGRFHQKNEVDLQFMIKRILGYRYSQAFNFISVLYMFAVAQINMIIACSLIYPVISAIISNSASQNEFTFMKFSYQILGIIYGFILFPTFLIKNISPLLKLPAFGAIATLSSIIFIVLRGSSSTITTLISKDYSVLPSIFGLAFLGHTLVVPLLHNSPKQNNQKEIIIAFLITFTLYQIIGYFGSCALNGRVVQDNLLGFTILDYFPQDDYLVRSLQILIFVQISSLFPIIQFFTRLRFMKLINLQSPPKWAFVLFSVIFTVICMVFEILNLNLTNLISYTGAIVGFFVAYLIPISFELFSYKKQELKIQLIDSQEDNQIYQKHKPSFLKKVVCGILMSMGTGILLCPFL